MTVKSQKAFSFNEEECFKIINKVIDPELGIGLVDLGLIYKVDFNKKNNSIKVTMTLTSMGCPAGPQMMGDIKKTLLAKLPVKSVSVDLVWDPPWTPDLMDPDIRDFIYGKMDFPTY